MLCDDNLPQIMSTGNETTVHEWLEVSNQCLTGMRIEGFFGSVFFSFPPPVNTNCLCIRTVIISAAKVGRISETHAVFRRLQIRGID